MDIPPIVARLSVIADSVNALKELQRLTYDEFAREHVLHGSALQHDLGDLERFAQYVNKYLARTEDKSNM